MTDTVTPTDRTEGKTYWRSLEQLADTPEFRKHVENEFPHAAGQLADPVSRRKFLGLMGAAVAMSGLVGCRRPLTKVLPYARMPEDVLPGVPKQYATVFPFRGVAEGVLVESHEGRPGKIEGNPDHPTSGGATHGFAQAETWEMYDPDRTRLPMLGEEERGWDEFRTWLDDRRTALDADRGAGLRVLAGPSVSPVWTELQRDLVRRFPRAVWHTWEPLNLDNVIEGSRIAFGRSLRTQLDLAQADVILGLDSDFLHLDRNAVQNARGYAEGRRVQAEQDSMNRLYVAESRFTVTGANADHRLPMPHGQIADLARGVATELTRAGVTMAGLGGSALRTANLDENGQAWARAVARDLAGARGRAVVVVGPGQPPELHALAHLINRALGSVGSVVRYTTERIPGDQTGSLRELTDSMGRGQVDTLVILGGNPVYDAPADLDFAAKLDSVPNRVHAGLHANETAAACTWHLPLTHFMESWGDGHAWDGTISIQQPLIEPLFEGKSAIEIVGLLAGRDQSSYDLVRSHYQRRWSGPRFQLNWDNALANGVLSGTNDAEVPAAPNGTAVAQALNARPVPANPSPSALELVFREDASSWDGRYANNGWLQELPDNLTKLTWDNAAQMSPATAGELGVGSGDMVTLTHQGRSLTLAAWVQPGLPRNTINLPLGYGRTRAGRIGNGVGFDTYRLRTAEALYAAAGATLAKAPGTYAFSTTQDHGSMENRPLAREATLEHYKAHPDFVEHMVEVPEAVTLYTDREYDFTKGYQWGMSIDLNTCIGCNACAIACQSENNIAIVGKDEVARGREMHWIRVDRYFQGDTDAPEVAYQPVPCQQCENAPCESVCPVNATVHSDEGLNDMVYNRCIGTRYCNNNCPYKVRKFNYFDWRKEQDKVQELAMNPDVTVRVRGVMEKCTYCVQRINRARVDAKVENRKISDGAIRTACQQVCPTGSIVFGNINDPRSRVTGLKQQNRDYVMLEEINTRPRTSYLAKLRNPNPELEHA